MAGKIEVITGPMFSGKTRIIKAIGKVFPR